MDFIGNDVNFKVTETVFTQMFSIRDINLPLLRNDYLRENFLVVKATEAIMIIKIPINLNHP